MSSLSPSPSASKKQRILALHGWRTNGPILESMFHSSEFFTDPSFPLAPGCQFEFDAPTAPHAARGPPVAQVTRIWPNQDYFEWFVFKAGWSGWALEGVDSSLRFLDSLLRSASPPYDGVLGFSQGAAILSLYLGLCQQGKLPGREEGVPIDPGFRYAICIGGVPAWDLRSLALPLAPRSLAAIAYSETIRIPSLHIIGKTDPFYLQSKLLQTKFDRSTAAVAEWGGGHWIPSPSPQGVGSSQSKTIRAFFEATCGRGSFLKEDIKREAKGMPTAPEPAGSGRSGQGAGAEKGTFGRGGMGRGPVKWAKVAWDRVQFTWSLWAALLTVKPQNKRGEKVEVAEGN